MLKKATFMAVAAFGLLANPVLSSASAQDNDKESKSEKDDGDRKVCKSEPVTGSRTRVNRVCMTQREWDAQKEAAQRGVRDLGRDSTNNRTNAPSPQ
jgi:hypothetical protein